MEEGLEEDVIRTLLSIFIQCFSNVFITLWKCLTNVSCIYQGLVRDKTKNRMIKSDLVTAYRTDRVAN
jgi:hypothetical protein